MTRATDQLARGLGKGDTKDGGEKKGASKGEGKPNAGKGEGKEDTKEKKVEPKDGKENKGSVARAAWLARPYWSQAEAHSPDR